MDSEYQLNFPNFQVTEHISELFERLMSVSHTLRLAHNLSQKDIRLAQAKVVTQFTKEKLEFALQLLEQVKQKLIRLGYKPDRDFKISYSLISDLEGLSPTCWAQYSFEMKGIPDEVYDGRYITSRIAVFYQIIGMLDSIQGKPCRFSIQTPCLEKLYCESYNITARRVDEFRASLEG